MSENMAKTGGPMTLCSAASDKTFTDCKYFEGSTRDMNKCRYCAFDEFCICIKAYLDAKDVSINVIDTFN